MFQSIEMDRFIFCFSPPIAGMASGWDCTPGAQTLADLSMKAFDQSAKRFF